MQVRIKKLFWVCQLHLKEMLAAIISVIYGHHQYILIILRHYNPWHCLFPQDNMTTGLQ